MIAGQCLEAGVVIAGQCLEAGILFPFPVGHSLDAGLQHSSSSSCQIYCLLPFNVIKLLNKITTHYYNVITAKHLQSVHTMHYTFDIPLIYFRFVLARYGFVLNSIRNSNVLSHLQCAKLPGR